MEIQKAIQDLQVTLLTNRNTIFQELGESLNTYRVYQLVYYIERMWSYIAPSRGLTTGDLGRIVRFADVFSRFEEAIKGASVNSETTFRLKKQEI